MRKKLLASIVILSAFACQRKAIHKEHPEFIGKWSHHDDNGEYWCIDISDKSWGTITVYDADFVDQYKFGENPHRWRYNEQKHLLTLRLIPDKFHVDQLPTTSSILIISEKDTIQPGDIYCILDGNYYKKY